MDDLQKSSDEILKAELDKMQYRNIQELIAYRKMYPNEPISSVFISKVKKSVLDHWKNDIFRNIIENADWDTLLGNIEKERERAIAEYTKQQKSAT